MDAAVPVETAVEDRVERPGPERIGVARQHMIELVRIFAAHMAERDPGHLRSHGLIEPHSMNPAT